VVISDGRPRTVTYRTDLSFQIIRRDEADNISTQGDPHEVWYRFAGKQMGYVGNNGQSVFTGKGYFNENNVWVSGGSSYTCPFRKLMF